MPCIDVRHRGTQPALYSGDLKVRFLTLSGALASLRMSAQVCL